MGLGVHEKWCSSLQNENNLQNLADTFVYVIFFL